MGKLCVPSRLLVLFSVVWIVGLSVLTVKASSSFKDYLPGWPAICCNLELQEHRVGNLLPKDTVFGGIVGGKRWGYGLDLHASYLTLGVSELFTDKPIILDYSHSCENSSLPVIHVLTNPNKCDVTWYTTRYWTEQFFNSTGVTMEDEATFLPAYQAKFFAWRNFPGSSLRGGTGLCNENRQSYSRESGTRILGVNCLTSLVTMAGGRLIDMHMNESVLQTIRDTQVVHFKRTFNNKSNHTQKQSVAFSSEITNSLYVSVSESFSSSKCDAQRNSFSNHFKTRVTTEVGVKTKAWFVSVSAKVGTDISAGFDKMTEEANNACSAQSSNKTESSFHKEIKKYSFSDEITIPANSQVTVSATSNPMRGNIPFTMTYELTPKNGNMNDKLHRGLEYYKFGDRVEKTDRGTVLVHFNGEMVVDSGYEIVVDVVAKPLTAGGAPKHVMMLQSLFQSFG